jgi:2-dehydropantoate 2-reductase
VVENQIIYIIGAGAIGKVLAVFLKQEGKNVILVRGSVSNEPTITSHVKVELVNKPTVEASVEQTTLDKFDKLNGVIVITSKSFGNHDLAIKLKGKAVKSPIVLLQNGLDVEQNFIDQGFEEIYRCVLFATSQSISENVFRFQPVTDSAIGVIKGSVHHLHDVVNALNCKEFPFRAEENIQMVIWKKAISNCVFNSICPLLEIDNGVFHRNEKALSIAKRIIKECIGVANAAGVNLTEEEVIENLLKISKASDGQLISTYQDIRNKRMTEIDTFNFAIAALAKKFQMDSMVTETKLLGELTKLKSDLNLQ